MLQIATQDQVFIFDLRPLVEPDSATSNEGTIIAHQDGTYKLDRAALDACLTAVLAGPKPYKLGCGLAGDLGALAQALPGMQAFRRSRGVVELRCGFS